MKPFFDKYAGSLTEHEALNSIKNQIKKAIQAEKNGDENHGDYLMVAMQMIQDYISLKGDWGGGHQHHNPQQPNPQQQPQHPQYPRNPRRY